MLMNAWFSIRLLTLLALLYLATACGTVPDQRFLKKGSLSGIRRVGVSTSSHELSVRQHRESMEINPVVLVSPLAAVILEPVDWAIRSGADASQARVIRANRPKETIAQRLSAHFIRRLSDSRVFESVQEIPADVKGSQEAHWLSGQGAVIRLRITDVSLRLVTHNEFSLFVELSAEMLSLRAGKEQTVLWSRIERTSSNELHTLDFYKTQGIAALDEVLGKLAGRLADDLIYTK